MLSCVGFLGVDVCEGVRSVRGQGSGTSTAVGKRRGGNDFTVLHGKFRSVSLSLSLSLSLSTICKWLILIGNTPRSS